MTKLGFWLDNARKVALPQSIMPAVTALCLSLTMPDSSIAYGLVAVFGISMAHLSINLLDDYFDFKNHNVEIREQLSDEGNRVRTHKCGYLANGQATLKQTLMVACIFAAIALLCGAIIFLKRGYPIAILTAAAALLGFFYSAKPLRLCYRGLGEIVCFLMFGPMLMTGVFIAACGTANESIVVTGIAVGLAVTNILYTHSLLDATTDSCSRKRTLAVIVKNDNGKLAISWMLCFMPYLITILACLLNYLSCWYMLACLSFPLSLALYTHMHSYIKNGSDRPVRRSWYGPMENWDAIVTHNLDWFMLRWYLSRNAATLFSLLISTISIILYFAK